MPTPFLIRPITVSDDAAMAAIIRRVMPEFGADGPGFAIHDAEVDRMCEAYAQLHSAYFVVERDGQTNHAFAAIRRLARRIGQADWAR